MAVNAPHPLNMPSALPVNVTFVIVTVTGYTVEKEDAVAPNKIFGLFRVQFVKEGAEIEVLPVNMPSAFELFSPTIFADASDVQPLNMLLVLIARFDGNVIEGTPVIDLLEEHHSLSPTLDVLSTLDSVISSLVMPLKSKSGNVAACIPLLDCHQNIREAFTTLCVSNQPTSVQLFPTL